jgi:peptidyl-prolyl cis-trans isomerase SurA
MRNDESWIMLEQIMTTGGARLFFAAISFALALAVAQSPATAQQVVVVVSGSPITSYDIEQRSKFTRLSSQKTPSRQEVIEELIDERVKIQEAKRYKMDAPSAEIDRGIANMAARAGLTVAQFTQALASNGVALGTIKTRMRAELAWSQLVRARFPATLQIDEKDIREILQTKKDDGQDMAYDYKLRPIIFIVPKGSAESVIQARKREAEALRTRFQNCDDGLLFVRGLRDVAVRDPVRRTSADLPPTLRDVLNDLPVGKLTKPEVTGQGVEVFALCEKTQTTSDTPQKRKAHQEIFGSRFEAQSKRYLNEVRRSSMIEYK